MRVICRVGGQHLAVRAHVDDEDQAQCRRTTKLLVRAKVEDVRISEVSAEFRLSCCELSVGNPCHDRGHRTAVTSSIKDRSSRGATKQTAYFLMLKAIVSLSFVQFIKRV